MKDTFNRWVEEGQRRRRLELLEAENARLLVQVTALEGIISDLQAAMATGYAALDDCKQRLEAYRDATVVVQTPDGQTVTRPLIDCLAEVPVLELSVPDGRS